MKCYLILLCLIPPIALAVDVVLRVDGRVVHRITAETATLSNDNGRMIVDVRTASKPPPEPDPPEPGPPTGECGKRPIGTQISDLNWRQPGSQTTHALGTGVRAFKIKTTTNQAYEGQIATSFTTLNPAYRTLWISQCPGDLSSADPRCVAQGYESAVLHWTQNPGSRIPCKLSLDATYYINIKNAAKGNPGEPTCTAGNCPFFMIVYTNQRP